MLAIVLPMVFAIAPAFAPATSLTAPVIVDPLKAPGTILTVYVTIDDVTDLYSFDYKMAYNPAVLQCVSYTPIGASPNFMRTDLSKPYGIDNTLGEVWFSGIRFRAGGFTTGILLPFLSMKFNVVGRGISALAMHDIVFTDTLGNPITPIVLTNGSFDNNFQGKLIAPNYQNEALIPEEVFGIDISVDDVTKLWGYQMTLSYDSNVMAAFDWTPLGTFTQYGPSEIGEGYITFSANSYYGDPTGLSTGDPVAIVTIYFVLVQEGWSTLDISSEKLANVYGDAQTLEVFDGAFASVNVADLKARAAWPDTYKAHAGTIDTLYARIATNATGAPVTVWAVFTVYDREFMIELGEIKTTTATLGPLSEAIVTAEFDTNAWGESDTYKVSMLAQAYCDVNGDGVADFAGIRIKPVNIQVRP